MTMNAEADERLLISRAWTETEFRRRLLADGTATLKAERFPVREGLVVNVVENTDTLVHIVLPVKPPNWEAGGGEGTVDADGADPAAFGALQHIVAKAWSDPGYRARLIADGTAVARSEGLAFRDGISVRILENSPTLLHIVLPVQPSSGPMDDAELEALSGGGLVGALMGATGGALQGGFEVGLLTLGAGIVPGMIVGGIYGAIAGYLLEDAAKSM
ncbi:MAG: NHLP leader peptide family natural product precursor [Azospirillum sp.]|nr:NHLP leader peptide family natural product precursor [Azospirillum sp.]